MISQNKSPRSINSEEQKWASLRASWFIKRYPKVGNIGPGSFRTLFLLSSSILFPMQQITVHFDPSIAELHRLEMDTAKDVCQETVRIGLRELSSISGTTMLRKSRYVQHNCSLVLIHANQKLVLIFGNHVRHLPTRTFSGLQMIQPNHFSILIFLTTTTKKC